MKTVKTYSLVLLVSILFLSSCGKLKNQSVTDPLPSWNDTKIKKSIISFIADSLKNVAYPMRIAVFDMDGTISCETPLWPEMYVAVAGLNKQLRENPSLIQYPEYKFAQKLAINPGDTSVLNNWGAYVDSMVWKAYAGVDHQAYIDTAANYMYNERNKNKQYNIRLSNMFYQPMLELIRYLKDNHFEVYIVSGSVQGVVWSICPAVLSLDRDHLIGTEQILKPVYNPKNHKTSFVIQKGIFTPKDDKDGKAENIYSRLGLTPIFAFGNTTGDFGMFHLTSTNPFPHAVYMLNHDDDKREYKYPPYHGAVDPGWQDSLKVNNWQQVNMSTEFKTVWMK